jgi:HSP20 family protein
MSMRDLLPFSRMSSSSGNGRSTYDDMHKMLTNFFGEMSLPGSELFSNGIPLMDVSESDQKFYITAELPGMDIKDIQITTIEGCLTIKGEKKKEEKEEHSGYFRQERVYGAFQRSIALPNTADLEHAEANFKNGILTLSIPKKPGAQTKELKITAK